MWVLAGGQLETGELIWITSIFGVFSNQTEAATSQVHLNARDCPSCILLMAQSTINKVCSWLLDAACLPGTLFPPTLLYNMHEDFWNAYRASPRWITNGKVFVKHTVATFPPPSDMSNVHDLCEYRTFSHNRPHTRYGRILKRLTGSPNRFRKYRPDVLLLQKNHDEQQVQRTIPAITCTVSSLGETLIKAPAAVQPIKRSSAPSPHDT